jgi:serine/threonine protein kinase
MKGFFDDLDANDLDLLDEMELPVVGGPAGVTAAGRADGDKGQPEEDRKDGERTVEYFDNFRMGKSIEEPECKSLRLPGADGSWSDYLIIK